MIAKQLFEDITAKVSDIIQDSPIKDLEKNVKTAVTAAFSRLDLVTREEFEIQQQMIEHLCSEIASLQDEIARLREQTPDA
ncbi:MAG: accessory factor UbiK family protein [Neisseria sp.]|nr:accessory factor UbiK family protein [Neisseria sp.]